MEMTLLIKLFHFLQEDIGIPAAEISTAQKLLGRLSRQQPEQSLNLLPIVLWQYGLVTLDQLNRVLDWLEAAQGTI
ncbi:DUF2949 domain-containing protein [Leptothermofonsia sichuanensis E412]|jgi:hypothetical protein|uniref:DUF2949 domain-containing protein n=1 Tax=Leptothermofonsia sichuanensis TaxID=2917832 RepID=UPI001CA6B46C|nr:DUF2949 domain-containing protein [Leptothermofonsia sichuanensis]QZZ21465.1 DUF2949 domain-containing protein [Leptothermofonsia sichuanensis E412]